jgi:hypothetical protein
MSRTHNHPTRPSPSCKNHPGVPAVDGTSPALCQSCLHYAKLAPKVMGSGSTPKKKP